MIEGSLVPPKKIAFLIPRPSPLLGTDSDFIFCEMSSKSQVESLPETGVRHRKKGQGRGKKGGAKSSAKAVKGSLKERKISTGQQHMLDAFKGDRVPRMIHAGALASRISSDAIVEAKFCLLRLYASLTRVALITRDQFERPTMASKMVLDSSNGSCIPKSRANAYVCHDARKGTGKKKPKKEGGAATETTPQEEEQQQQVL